MVASDFGFEAGTQPAHLVPGRRVLQQERSDEGHHEEDDTENGERGAPAVRRDEPQVRHGPEDRRAAAVAGHGQTDGQAALVREPLRHDRDRRRVAETVTDADDDAEADDQVRQAVGLGGEQEARRQEDAARDRDLEGTELVLKASRDDEGEREDDDGPAEDLDVSARFQPNSFSRGATKTLQAYSEPRARFIKSPPTTRHHRLM